jgi:general L-amino acid transport system permease protein
LALSRRLRRRQLLATAGLTLIALLAASLADGLHASVEVPALHGFNFAGGAVLGPEFTALLIGLVVNFAAVISEIVRAGVLAVPRGQWDAGRSLGLSFWRTLRLIVLPQALRVAMPLLTSTYLSLAKSSSLAVAIGFPDLASVIGTSANQTGQAVETMLILMGAYLALSLGISAAMNRINQRLLARG